MKLPIPTASEREGRGGRQGHLRLSRHFPTSVIRRSCRTSRATFQDQLRCPRSRRSVQRHRPPAGRPTRCQAGAAGAEQRSVHRLDCYPKELLVDHFLERAAHEIGKELPRPPRELYALLSSYRFPGNVRELEGILSDAIVRHESGMLSLDPIRALLRDRSATDVRTSEGGATASRENPFTVLETLPLLRNATSQLIEEAMRRAGDNQTLAAHLLGMSRTTLNKRLQKSSEA